MQESLSQIQIEEFLEKRFKSLRRLKPDICDFMFPSLINFESKVEADYLDQLSDSDKDQMIMKTKKKFADSYYEGDLLNEKRHGLGRMYYDSGRYYFGEWRYDLREGRGMEHYTNGNNYKGVFSKGKADGIGIFRWANGEIYEGQWKEGLKHGKGIWKGNQGDYYIGYWKTLLLMGGENMFGLMVILMKANGANMLRMALGMKNLQPKMKSILESM